MDDRGHLYEDKLDNLVIIRTVIKVVHADELHEHVATSQSEHAAELTNKLLLHLVLSLKMTIIVNKLES